MSPIGPTGTTGPTGPTHPAIADVLVRSPQRLVADRSRVITRLFVPGQEAFDHQESRTSPVLERLLALDEGEVQRTYDDVLGRFDHRHRDLAAVFGRHADELADRLDPARELSTTRRLLIGASFTCEYAIEGAALCNPSLVAHPDQTGMENGSLRVVMSVRAIGEGHLSSIGFRTGTIDRAGGATIDDASAFATTGSVASTLFDATLLRGEVRRLHGGGDSADFVLDALGDEFTMDELEARLERLQGQLSTRSNGLRTIALLRQFAQRTYGVCFAPDTSLSERVLFPAMPAEANGMEDARFVHLREDDGSSSYYATYTAYDGSNINQQLLSTDDFESFSASPIVGRAAANKGLALFPRRIRGRYAALSRSDRETNTIAFTDNIRQWDTAMACQLPTEPWEVLQLGNCGSPIETEAGWLVLTHGVGPMRTYSLGAVLLDLDDPTQIIGRLCEPLLCPAPDEQDGYVPNVVYSCGALVHAGTLVIPYGIGDAAIGIASVALDDLLGALTPTG